LVDALVWWRDTRWGHCTLLPVDDQLIVTVPADEADEATRELVRCMEMDLLGVKIVAEPSKPAFAWADSAQDRVTLCHGPRNAPRRGSA
jgi:hypothetical protein